MLLANHQGTAIKWMVESAAMFYKSENTGIICILPPPKMVQEICIFSPNSNLNEDLKSSNRV